MKKEKMSLKSIGNVLSRKELKKLWRVADHAGCEVILAMVIILSAAVVLRAVSGLYLFVNDSNRPAYF